MDTEEEKSKLRCIIGAVASLAIIGSIAYILVVGADLVSGLILLSAVGGVAGPVVASGEGLIDIITGIFEAFMEGIQAALSAIADVVGSFFG